MAGSTVESNISRPTSDVISPRQMRSRAQSISSDRPSTVGYSNLMVPPPMVSPEAAFIAATAASQIVTNDHDSHADTWYDQNSVEPAGETAVVTDAALHLVNGFLDQLLFNFLQVSKATSLAALRPAVSEVLKPKLAKDTIRNADEELREYLGGGDEEDYVLPQGANTARDWDLELVWKRTRLRCMVYSSLGDLEEEDEDLFMEQENLEIGSHEQISDVISPAVAIFLTSVLEYMGELTLTVAGQAAYNRLRIKMEKDLKDGTRNPSEVADRIVVEELDMERVALDRTLGRLWRGWKKRIRAPPTSPDLVSKAFSRPYSYSKMEHSATDTLTANTALASDAGSDYRKSQDHPSETIIEDVEPADIPLPMGNRDVDEIEVPGLVQHSDDEDADEDDEPVAFRPKSMLIISAPNANGLAASTVSRDSAPFLTSRKRSNSLPSPAAAPFSLVASSSNQLEPFEVSAEENDTENETTDKNYDEVSSEAKSSVELETRYGGRKLKAIAGAAAVGSTTVAQDSDSDYGTDDGDEEAVFEQAAVMTSSRVSVGGSSSPSASESGKPYGLNRSSSVHSARIIDVPGPRSPIGSRPTSVDAGERARPVSLSGLTSLSRSSSPEEIRKFSGPLAVTKASHAIGHRSRTSLSNATAISESDEDDAVQDSRSMGKPSVDAATIQAGSQASWSTASRKVSPGHQQRPSEPKIPLLKTSGLAPVEGRSPDVPRRSPGHSGFQASRNEGKGLERIRTNDTEEDIGLPLPYSTVSRPAHTATSSISSGTSRLKAVRTSEDNSSSRAESVARNFEELMQSNQTITYTLTPENMRDVDPKRSLDSPVVTKPSRKSEDSRSFTHSRSSPTIPETGPSPTIRRSPGLSNHAVMETITKTPAGLIPRAPPNLAVSNARTSGPQAREARVPSESTADFAEFIRSTGPPSEGQSPLSRNGAGQWPSSPVNGGSVMRGPEARRTSTNSNRARFQPREATVDNKSNNADLLNFIRQGPPIAASNHRIPRHVAPFRTTMDSDQMSGAGGRAVDASIPEIRHSQASTNQTENSMRSMQSSVNSNTALLKNNGPSVPSKLYDDDEDMMPRRKTRRVRDPYAIDFSDEEDDDLISEAPRPPAKKEESLAEFLQNYDPPPEPASAPRRQPKKKASAPSLMNRFRSGAKDTKEPVSPGISRAMTTSESRSLHSRAGGSGGSKGYIPIQVNMPQGYDRYGPIDNSAGRPRVVSAASSAGRVPMKKFEPRDAVSKRSETSDLAAFLRDTEPPAAPPMRAATPSRNEESSSLSRMFGRRKKSMV